MKRRLSFLMIVLTVVFLLPSCTAHVTVTDTTTITANPTAGTLADQGFLDIDGVGSFYYQSFAGQINQAVSFHGVTFTESYYVQNGTTITYVTVPLMYNVSVTFGDDTAEILRLVGLPAENAIDVHLTDYKTPRAGIMMVTNNGVRHIYILVSTT